MKRFAAYWADISLRTKITGVTVFILFLGLIVAGAGTLSVLHPILTSNQTNTLAQLRVDPSPALARGANINALDRDDVLYANQQYYVAVLNSAGELSYDNTLGRNDASFPRVPKIDIESVINDGDRFVMLRSADGTEWRAVVAPIMKDNQPAGSLLIASSTAGINQVIATYVTIFTGFGIAVIFLGAALTRLLITTTLLPLAEVEKTALEISRGDYSKRIMVSSPNTEVGHLGESLNVMLDRLDGSLEDRARTIEQMRRFIGDASHELRTPLVSVRGYAELYRMGALQDGEQVGQAMERIEKEAIRMTSLVEDLLALARLDEGRELVMKSLDLNRLAHDAALDARAQAPDRAVTVIDDPACPVVVGDEHKVRQLLTNLIGNAMRHTAAGSPIEIVVSTPGSADDGGAEAGAGVSAGGGAGAGAGAGAGSTNGVRAGATRMSRFEIVDHGEGVPEQIREKIFDRFWRADNSRNRETGGSGLGLAIVKSIVDAHRGKVSVVETPGGGATFRVDLPAEVPAEGFPSTGAITAVNTATTGAAAATNTTATSNTASR